MMITQKKYSPLQSINPRLITPYGLILVRSDENLLPETISKLIDSEMCLFVKPRYRQYLYLIQPNPDLKKVYIQHFLSNERLGIAHVATLISENKEQSYAELVAGYSSDRDIPFIASYMILNAYRTMCNGFREINRSLNETLKYTLWEPALKPIQPPVSFYKMFQLGRQSIEGIQDDYLIETLRSVAYNQQATAQILKISTRNLSARLRSIGLTNDVMSEDEDIESWINSHCKSTLNTKEKIARDVRIMPPHKRQPTTCDIPRKKLVDALVKAEGDHLKAAKSLNINKALYTKMLEDSYPRINSKKIIQDSLLIAVFCAAENDLRLTAKVLNSKRPAIRKRLKKILPLYFGDNVEIKENKSKKCSKTKIKDTEQELL